MSHWKRLKWLVYRGSVMSPAEVVHRAGTAVRKLADGVLGTRQAIGHPLDIADYAFLAGDQPRLFKPPLEIDPADTQSLIRALIRGVIPVYGTEVQWTQDPEFWHTDPMTGAVWPASGKGRVSYRPGNPTGDVRVVWELNRLQHLVDLAAAAALPGMRDRIGRTVCLQFESWFRANAFPGGINFASAMENALRLLSLLHAFDLVRDAFGAGARNLLLKVVISHALHIERNLSLHSSAGNHTIAEALGLLYAGLLFPEHERAKQWERTANALLRQECPHQIRGDGGPAEQSTWYLLFITDLLDLAIALSRHKGLRPAREVESASARAHDYLSALGESAQALPRIGDSDDGVALSRHLQRPWHRPFDLPLKRTFPETGVSVASFARHDRLFFLHKDLGMSPGFGHGHSDALSLIFFWHGFPLLLDPGTYLYGGSPQWRRYFRSAAAHNTVSIAGQDQARQVAAFMWRSPYQSRLLLDGSTGSRVCLLASHDGYRRLDCTHWRGVVYEPGAFLIVWDFVQASRALDIAAHWHTAGQIEDTGNAERFNIRTDEDLIPVRVSPWKRSVHAGSADPLLGWHSSGYGRLSPCQTVRLTARTAPDAELVTAFGLAGNEVADTVMDDAVRPFRQRAAQE